MVDFKALGSLSSMGWVRARSGAGSKGDSYLMDRTGKIILVASILLLIAGPILQSKFGPKSKLPVFDDNASINGTNLVS